MNGRGSRLREEIEIIPLGWVIASLIAFFAVQVLFWVVVPHFAGPHDLPAEPWWTLLRICASLLVLASILLTGYIYGDAKRRGMNALLWTLLALLLPKPIGSSPTSCFADRCRCRVRIARIRWQPISPTAASAASYWRRPAPIAEGPFAAILPAAPIAGRT